jgi:hypothetical protein
VTEPVIFIVSCIALKRALSRKGEC